jgi:hypothetical protein
MSVLTEKINNSKAVRKSSFFFEMNFLKDSVCILVMLLFSSCMTTSRMNKLVTKHYVSKHNTILKPELNQNLDMDYGSLKYINGFCKSRYKSFYTVPMLLYTFSKEQIECEINYRLITWPLIEKLNNYMGQEYYKEKFYGKKIIIAWQNLPNTLEHKYVNHFIALPFTIVDIDVTKVHFKSDLGKIACFIKIVDSEGHELKSVKFEETMNPVFIETFYEGPRRDFIRNGLNIMDQRYNMAFHQLINSILKEI